MNIIDCGDSRELLKTVDSVLDSLVNLNEPEQYQAALERLHAEE